jgi:hypothetical protein
VTALDDRPTTRHGDPWQHWTERAACRQAPAIIDFFPTYRANARPAIAWCNGCPVLADCDDEARSMTNPSGVWGGAFWNDGTRHEVHQLPRTARSGGQNPRPPEQRAEAIAEFHRARPDYPSDRACSTALAPRYGVEPLTIRMWVKRAAAGSADTDTDERHRP